MPLLFLLVARERERERDKWNDVFTDEEGQVIRDTQIGCVVGQSVIDHGIRHPIEGENKKFLSDIRMRD